MKKILLTMVAALVSTAMSFAQSNLVATLSHDGEISVFHGSTALKQAMIAATHGDIITLAGGRYEAADITKAVVLRGAGIKEDATTGAFPTKIIGSININIPENTSHHLEIEGIYGEYLYLNSNLDNATIQKSRFSNINSNNPYSVKITSLTWMNCRITDNCYFPANISATFVNSVVSYPFQYSEGHLEFTNCLVISNIQSVRNSLSTNCILGDYKYTDQYLQSTNIATNCIGLIYDNKSIFRNINQSTNTSLSSEEFNALFKPNTFYELTDAAKAKYLGSDGKEVGIYGGNFPYNVRIPSPQITKCNVAAKTTADGKLSVDIEVKAAE